MLCPQHAPSPQDKQTHIQEATWKQYPVMFWVWARSLWQQDSYYIIKATSQERNYPISFIGSTEASK